MSGTHVYIAIPCFGGMIYAACHRQVLHLTHLLDSSGIAWTLDHELGESLVQRARNHLAHRFLKSPATHMLFIDADLEFRPPDVIGMLGADKPLVGGLYPKKTLNMEAIRAACLRNEPTPMNFAADYCVNVVQAGTPGGEVRVTSDNGCVPVHDLPTGFMLVAREVLVRMAAEMPETLYYSDRHDSRGEAMHALFDCGIVDGLYLSEDWLFSRRWQRMGGTCWAFLPAVLGHVGTHTYRGDISAMFRPADGVA